MAFVNNLLGKYLSFFYKKAAGSHLPCSGMSDLSMGRFFPGKKVNRSVVCKKKKIKTGLTPLALRQSC